MKVLFLSFFIFLSNLLMAGCGGCQPQIETDKNSKSSSFISSVPINGKLEGFVVASCNKCNLGKKTDKKCSMGIKVNQMVYEVKNYNHDHSEAHNHDGICNALRIAHVSGKIQGYDFIADTFESLLGLHLL